MTSPMMDINIPHAGTVVDRLGSSLAAEGFFETENGPEVDDLLKALGALLSAFPEDPSEEVAVEVSGAAAHLGRAIVRRLEGAELAGTQVGRHVRNFFECLGLADEGASLALAVGEDPASPLRPTPQA